MTPEHSNFSDSDFSEHSEYVEPNQPELITERLTLRHLREADIPDIYLTAPPKAPELAPNWAITPPPRRAAGAT